jgi:hypothetical protein
VPCIRTDSHFPYLTSYYILVSVDFRPVLDSSIYLPLHEIPPEFSSHCTSLKSILISFPLSGPVSLINFVLLGFLTRTVYVDFLFCCSCHNAHSSDLLWFQHYDMIYSAATGLTPGGSTVHIYTKTVHTTTQ